MKWSKSEEDKENKVVIPNSWLYIHYYEALSALFRIENALRTFVFLVLKTELGTSWSKLDISSDDGSHTTIEALAKRRISQNDTFGYLGYNIDSHLMHLTSGELVNLIVADSYWPYFNRYFRAAKSVVTLKLQEIGNIRNSLAHFRPIKSDDVEVVKQNATQILSGVESVIFEATSCANRVPTNTQDEWYKELCVLGTQNCQFLFHQSRDSNWIRLTLQFRTKALKGPGEKPSGYVLFEVLALDTPKAIQKFENIQKYVTILTEDTIHVGWKLDSNMLFRKDLMFTFGINVLVKHYCDIKSDFEKLLSQIAQEAELIEADNLAQGELLRLTKIGAQERELKDRKYWSFDLNPLKRPVRVNDPPEYWGNFASSDEDLITETNNFPWMPIDISNISVPF